jgi:hypothetical protein
MKRIPTWAWFFILLAVLTAATVSVEIGFNLAQQLTPEQVAAARERWRQHAPAAFELEYDLKRQAREPIRYQAVIRDGEVVAVTVDGQELEPVLYALHDLPPLFQAAAAWLGEDAARHDGTVEHIAPANGKTSYRVEVRQGETVVKRNNQVVGSNLAASYTPAAQLAAIARRLEIDRQPGAGRGFCVATFQRRTGLVERFVRSLSATRERVEIQTTDFKSLSSP